jgi:hypothetical protein
MSGKYWMTMSVLVCGLLTTSASLVAHHSIASEYDFDKPVTLKGVLTQVEWINPHSMFHLEVKGRDGKMVPWLFQTGGAGALRRQKQFVGVRLVGESFTVSGFAAKNGKSQGFIKSLTFADGKVVTMWFGDPNGN